MARNRVIHQRGRNQTLTARHEMSSTIEKAFALYADGRVYESLSIINRVMTSSAPDASLLNFAAICHAKLGDSNQAISCWRHALFIEPEHAEIHYNLGKLYKENKYYEEAEASYRQALRLQSDYANAHLNLGTLLQELGRYEEAEVAYRQFLRIKPEQDYVSVHYNLGILLQEMKRDAEAEAAYRRVLCIQPDHAETHSNLGNLLKDWKRFEEAEASYRQALRTKPDYAVAHSNLGSLLREMKRFEESEASYRHALHINPDYAEAHNNLGVFLQDLKRFEEAEASYRHALRIKPDYAEVHNNLGVFLRDLKRFEEAEASYRHALRIKPDYAEAHNNLGNLLQDLKRFEEAEAAYRQALHIKLDYGDAMGGAYICARYQCQWKRILDDDLAIRNLLAQGVAILPLSFLTLPHEDGLLQRQTSAFHIVKRVGPILEMPPLSDPLQNFHRDRLRIGYLSADFCNHPVSHLFIGVLEAHNHEQFAFYNYAVGPEILDAYRQRFIQSCDLFRNLAPLSDEQAARQIADDEIDILIDLTGYTKYCRSEITARRPAPILVNWLGYPGTLGHPRMADYLIGDPIVSPPHMTEQFSETLALLPHCYQPNDRNRIVAPSSTRYEANLPADGFVFCNFNQSHKFEPNSFTVWCRLLKAVPGSVLWLLEPMAIAVANLRHEAQRRGIDPNRLVFASKRPPAEHLGRLALADLALDTFPYTSHTTGSDALWVGVPLITKIGNTFVSRVAASLLNAAGFPELITETWEEYFELALDLANNPVRLRSIRERLWTNRLTCSLFDTERFARDLERLYQRMWQDHGQGKKEPIVLPPGRI